MKNEKVVLNIIDMSKDGLGIAKKDGIVYFVKNAIVDDCVLCIITKVTKNVYYAKVVEILKKSKFRVESECDICEPCGGCQIMQIEYSEQLHLKKTQVISNLTRIANIDEREVKDKYDGIVGVSNLYNYRNKLQIPFSYKCGKVICGFYAERTHYIVECDECKAGFIGNGTIVEAIKKAIKEFNLSIYDENKKIGILRSVMMRSSNSILKEKFEVSLTLIVNDKNYQKNIDLYKKISDYIINSVKSQNFNIKTVSINVNTTEGNVILSDKNIIIYGDGYLKDLILGIDFYISPNSFYQVNMEMTTKLYNSILDMLKLNGSENIIDLYCGIGTISLLMSKNAKYVIGIESVEQAIKNAKMNKENNNITNADFICIEAENLIESIEKEQILNKMVKEGIDVVCVDPPRKGLDSKLIDSLIKLSPQKIIYVSCDSGTLARDLKILIESKEYKIDKIKNFDMFPHTMHVETVVLMSRVSIK